VDHSSCGPELQQNMCWEHAQKVGLLVSHRDEPVKAAESDFVRSSVGALPHRAPQDRLSQIIAAAGGTTVHVSGPGRALPGSPDAGARMVARGWEQATLRSFWERRLARFAS